jgi:hypothetical protein
MFLSPSVGNQAAGQSSTRATKNFAHHRTESGQHDVEEVVQEGLSRVGPGYGLGEKTMN